MPELTEVTDTKPREEENDSGTDSDGEDSIPELEDTAGEAGAGEASGAAAAIGEEGVSKNKQSRGEKKARKIMSKLGLKQVIFLLAAFSITSSSWILLDSKTCFAPKTYVRRSL